MKKAILVSTLSILFLSGCVGKMDYVRPETSVPVTNEIVVDRPIDEVWKNAVPALGKKFFVINNIDKSSGLINVSYTGDPERYIDCGRITSYVKNARGERNYDFPAAKSHQVYETMDRGILRFIDRKMELDGRVNLIFEELGATSTRITANVKYIVTKRARVERAGNGAIRVYDDTVSFNSNGSAEFPHSGKNPTTCVPTGRFERDILSAAG